MFPINCILHPTDFSQSAGNAFLLARALAKEHSARLILLHVMDEPVIGPAGTVPIPLPAPIDREVLTAQLEAIATSNSELRIECRLVEHEPASAILEVAREMDCDMIVMGTHGRTGLSRLLMGSIAEQVMRHATCPVLTVKSPIRGNSSSGVSAS